MANPPEAENQRTKTEDLASRRIEVFERLYGTVALRLAYHAAFPLTLTSDLLYCLRETFVPECPWYVVADVLLSGLCQPAGYDLYEIEPRTRDRLLRGLCDEFKEQRLKELADFMSHYINSRLQSNGNDRALVFGHRPDWTALAYLNSEQKDLIDIIEEELGKLDTSDAKDRIRWGVLVESYADLLSEKGFKPLRLREIAEKIFDGEPIADKLVERTPNPEPEEKLQPFDFETVTVNAREEVINREQKRAYYFVEYLGEEAGKPSELGIEMVAIPGGQFLMGTEDEEIERLVKKFDWDGYRREKPQHQVSVEPFFMGKYPVTQAQWRFVAQLPQVGRELKTDPSNFKGDNLPVERVSWYDAEEFCKRLSEYTGREYRLPSEAEWEYACRAGTTTPFYFGETITGELANYAASDIFADEPKGEDRNKTTEVGTFFPNSFGLYDMHGNVWEWCSDIYHNNYEKVPIDDNSIDSDNDNHSRVLRGGSWFNNPEVCRSAYRNGDVPDLDYSIFGFRVVCGGVPSRILQ